MALLDDYSEFESNVTPLVAETHDPVMAQWARFRDLFAEAMDGALYTIDDLEQRVAAKRAILFAGKESAIVGQVDEYVGGSRALQLLWACGEVAEIVAMLPGIEALARIQGCDRVVVEGRRAWERMLKGSGYDFFSVTLQKGL